MGKSKRTILLLFIVICSATAISDIGGVNYPSNFRSWQHIKSMVIQPGHPLEDPFGGIHHIYGNTKAMEGMISGEYEDGAVFVFDLLAYDDSNMTIVEKSRKRIDVMQFNAELFSDTGGWGYGTFLGDSTTEQLNQDVKVACYACHTGAESSNYVFSRYRP